MDEFYNQPFQYDKYKKATLWLKSNYNFLEVFSIGKSLLNHELFAFTIGNVNNTVLYVGGIHGMEWLTTLLLTRFLENICHSMATDTPLAGIDIRHTLEQRSITIIPCLNPDGIEIACGGPMRAGSWESLIRDCGDWQHWQANARGIDLNHNFDAGYELLSEMENLAGIDSPCATRYGGAYPFSEPESLALANFCKIYTPLQAYAFHSQGEEIYYEYGARTPARSKIMAQVLSRASGYHLAQPEEIASHGGFKDWFIEYFGAPAFTIEVGKGKNPLPLTDFCSIYTRLQEMLLISILL